jgi:hypothetical protein
LGGELQPSFGLAMLGCEGAAAKEQAGDKEELHKIKHKLKERIELSLYRHEWYVLTF